MASIDQQIQWLQNEQAKGITYSMVNRNGPNSYDCSSAGYYSLIAGGFFPAGITIGNTDSMFGDLERNGFSQLQPNAQGNFDTQRGDVAIWGKRGASSGSFGHFLTFTDANNVKHCNSYYNGIHDNNYDQLAGWNGNPEQTFYRYTGASTPVPPANPNDQIVQVGSWIKLPIPLVVNEVQQIGGVWQAKIDAICPTGFTWMDNGVPVEPLVEVDADGYATPDQMLSAGSSAVLPGKYQIVDLGQSDGMWVALIVWNSLKFWVDITGATEVPESDGGTPTPSQRPEAIPTTPVVTPVVSLPDPPVVVVVPTPPNKIPDTAPINTTSASTPSKETNQVKENPMSFTQDQQKELQVATQAAQDIAGSVNADPTVQTIISKIPQKVKVAVYIAGDTLIGLGLVAPSLAVVAGWGDVVRIIALSSVLGTAGAFILTSFGIYKSKSNG